MASAEWWFLLGLAAVAVVVVVLLVVFGAVTKHQPKPQRKTWARHLRSSSSHPHLTCNQSTIAAAIASTLRPARPLPAQQPTQSVPAAVAATDGAIGSTHSSTAGVLGRVAGELPTWRRWYDDAAGAVAHGLIDFKRRDYRKQARLEERRIVVGAHAIAYLDRASAVGKPILCLLHGFCGDKDLWVWFAKEIPDTYRVVIPDLPGFGDSSRLQTELYDSKSQAKRMTAFLLAIRHAQEPIHLAGNSMGGNIAGRMAIDAATAARPSPPSDNNASNKSAEPPEATHAAPDATPLSASVSVPESRLVFASLVLMGALGVGSPVMSPVGQEILAGRNPLMLTSVGQFEEFMRIVFVRPPPLPSFVLRYLAERIVTYQEFNRKIFSELATRNDDLAGELSCLDGTPTLVLWGDTDRVIDVSAAHLFHARIPHSQLAILPDCGHTPMAEQPHQTARTVSTFLASTHTP